MQVLHVQHSQPTQLALQLTCPRDMLRNEYSSIHETRPACKESRGGVSLTEGVSKWVDWVGSDQILETKLGLQVSGALKKESKLRLAGKDSKLRALLGLDQAPSTGSNPTGMRNKRSR